MKNWICLAFQYGFPKTLILLCAIKHDVCVKRIIYHSRGPYTLFGVA